MRKNHKFIYLGSWIGGVPTGYGTRYSYNGVAYAQGYFQNWMLNGRGRKFNMHGMLSYVGGLKEDLYHGYGTLYKAGRKMYQGGWIAHQKSSQRSGFGIEFDPVTGQMKRQGFWINGRFQKQIQPMSRYVLKYLEELEHYPLTETGPLMLYLMDYPHYFKILCNHFVANQKNIGTLQSILRQMNPIDTLRILDKIPSNVFQPYLMHLENSKKLQDQRFLKDYLEIPSLTIQPWNLENAIYHGKIDNNLLPNGYGHVLIDDDKPKLSLIYSGKPYVWFDC